MEWLDLPWDDRIQIRLQLEQANLETKADSASRPAQQIVSFRVLRHKLRNDLLGHLTPSKRPCYLNWKKTSEEISLLEQLGANGNPFFFIGMVRKMS